MGMNNQLMRPRASGFAPNNLTGLAVWFDASDSTTVTLSTGVSQWRTKVSGSTISATQVTGNNQPAYQTAQRNGKNALYFDGTNDAFNLGDLSATFPSGASVIIAYRVENDTEYAALDTNSNNQFWAYPTGRTYIGVFKGTRLNNVASPSMPTNSAAIVAIGSDSSAYTVYINNVVAHTAAADFASGTVHLIGLNNLGSFLKGWIYEIIYYNRALNASDMGKVYKYLSAKWAI